MIRRSDAAAGTVSITVPAAALSLLGIAVSWMGMVILDPRADDGFAPIFSLFGVPMIVSALVIQVAADAASAPRMRSLNRSFLWWILLVLPAGVLSTLLFAIPANADYFLADGGPWMLIWDVVFVYCALLLGALVWFFFVFPLAFVLRNAVDVIRGRKRWTAIIAPMPLIALGAVCLVGGMSINAELPGRAGWGAIIAAFLGIPGSYEIRWPEGLWIVRALLLFVVVAWGYGPFTDWLRRRRTPEG